MEVETNTQLGDVSAEATAEPTVQTAEATEATEPTAPTEATPEATAQAPDVKQNELFGRPENYDYSGIKLDGDMKLDESLTGQFNEVATKLNLSQKGANDLMTMAVELATKTKNDTINALTEANKHKIEQYKLALNSDKDVGGPNYESSIKTATTAYDKFFADEELREIFAESGLNVHPKFVKALKSIGALMQDDKIMMGDTPADTTRREDILFPSMA